jgi:hypothetical protein
MLVDNRGPSALKSLECLAGCQKYAWASVLEHPEVKKGIKRDDVRVLPCSPTFLALTLLLCFCKVYLAIRAFCLQSQGEKAR